MLFNKPFLYLLLIFFINEISSQFLKSPRLPPNASTFERLIYRIQQSGGYVSKDLYWDTSDNSNRRILAKNDLPKDRTIVFLPEVLSINISDPEINSKCKRVMNLILNPKHELECLVYFLSIDLVNPKSIFRPYYNTLPIGKETFTLNYNETLRQDIKNTEIEALTLYLEENVSRLYKSLHKSLPSDTKFETFQDTFLTVVSRNFATSTSWMIFSELLPFIDLFNHDTANTFLEHDPEWRGYILSPIRDIKANEEVFVNYGNHDNSELLTSYGYTWKNNENPLKFTFKCNDNLYKLCYTDDNFCWKDTIDEYYFLEKKTRTAATTLHFWQYIHDQVIGRSVNYDSAISIWEKYNKAVEDNDINMINIYTVKKEEVYRLSDMWKYWTSIWEFLNTNGISSNNYKEKLGNIASRSQNDDNIINFLKSVLQCNEDLV